MKKSASTFLGDSGVAHMKGPRISGHWILWGAVAFILIAVIWASLAKLDEVSRGSGKVIPSSKIQVIQNLEGGILRQLLVREGQIVEKGQILMHIDDTQFNADLKENRARVLALKIKVARLTAEVNDTPFKPDPSLRRYYDHIVTNEEALYLTRQLALKSKINILKQQVTQKEHELNELTIKADQLKKSYHLVRRELQLTKPLIRDGAVSTVEVLRLERQVNDLKGELEITRISIPKAKSALAETLQKLEELKLTEKTKSLTELGQAKSELAPLIESNAGLADKVKRTAIRSPVKGTVKEIHINTVGGVVKAGENLIEIVPLDDTLLIEAHIKPSDIGFIQAGQKATVKITAYDFSIYGGLEGTVEHISADSIENKDSNKKESYYKIYVRTQKNYLGTEAKPLTIIPGMAASVDILTGEKTVLDYLLKPILKAKQSALRER